MAQLTLSTDAKATMRANLELERKLISLPNTEYQALTRCESQEPSREASFYGRSPSVQFEVATRETRQPRPTPSKKNRNV